MLRLNVRALSSPKSFLLDDAFAVDILDGDVPRILEVSILPMSIRTRMQVLIS